MIDTPKPNKPVRPKDLRSIGTEKIGVIKRTEC